MENTITNYTTNKTLMEFYKSNIDFHIDYLLFLNTVGKISNQDFLAVAPILERIREKLYTSFGDVIIFNDIIVLNKQVMQKLRELLEKENLEELTEYVGSNIEIKDIGNFTAALTLKRELSKIENINNATKEGLIANSMITQMKELRIAGNIQIKDINESLIECFYQSLGIKYDKSDCIERYIYQILTYSKILLTMINKINNVDYDSENIDYLLNEFNQDLSTKSPISICNMIDEIKDNIKQINSCLEASKLRLEKQG